MHEGRVIPLSAATVAAVVLVIWWFQTPTAVPQPRIDPEDKARLDSGQTARPAPGAAVAVFIRRGKHLFPFRTQ